VEYFVIVLGFLNPFSFILAFYEGISIINLLFPVWNDEIVPYIGTTLMIMGGLLKILSRPRLGKYGTPVLHTGKDHELITKGLYKYVRHPMYSGDILVLTGPFLVFGSILMLLVMLILFFNILCMRINLEEMMLKEVFGEEYITYMKKTKRLIPFIY